MSVASPAGRSSAVARDFAQRAEPSHDECVALVQRVADAYGVRVDEIRSRGRERHLIESRHVAMAVLYRRNVSVVAISRLLARNHSTVVYAVDKCAGMAVVEELAKIAWFPALHRRLAASCGAAIATAVTAYVDHLINGKPATTQTYCGLVDVARCVKARMVVESWLSKNEQGAQIGRMRLQAARYGLRWKELTA